MQNNELNKLKKKFIIRRVAWGLFFIVLLYQVWYGRWKDSFSTIINIFITLFLIVFWIFGIVKAGRDAEKYIEYQKSGGEKYSYIKKGLKIQGLIQRGLAITFIGRTILAIILVIIIIFAVSIAR